MACYKFVIIIAFFAIMIFNVEIFILPMKYIKF